MRQYVYGKHVAEVAPAEGVTGVLCKSVDGEFVFRVYAKGGAFTDYDIARMILK